MSRSTHHLIKVAVGIIINPLQQVLVSLRPAHTSHGGLWEFPGGKFEHNETPMQALARELHEEIGVQVINAVPLLCVQHDYGTAHVELNTWRITEFLGTPYGREGQEIRWIDQHELIALPFPEGNRAIVQTLHNMLRET